MPYEAEVIIACIDDPPELMRTDTTVEGLGELIEDIAQQGLINPISIRDMGGGRYELMAGYRRKCAFVEMGKASIPARVYQKDEVDPDLLMGAENFHRTQVNPVEEANYFARLRNKYGISVNEIARRCKRSPGHVQQSLALLEGNTEVLDALREGKLNKAQANEINRIKDELGQKTALHYALNSGMTPRAIKHYREGREMSGVDTGSMTVMQAVQEAGPPTSRVSLLCMFCQRWHDMGTVQMLQGCNGCLSELTRASQVYNYWEKLFKAGYECQCEVCTVLPPPAIEQPEQPSP